MLKSYLTALWHQAVEHNNRNVDKCLEIDKKARVLDLGCDNGEICIRRVLSYIKSPHVYGIDIDEKCLQRAQKLGINVTQHDLNKPLPYKNSFFDCVTANQIIEHVCDTDIFVSEVCRVLKKGGYFVVSTENLSSWHNIAALTIGFQGFSQDISDRAHLGNPLTLNFHKKGPAHRRIFTLYGLSVMLRYYNFHVELSYGAGYYPFPQFFAVVLSKLDLAHSAFITIKARK